MVDGIWHIWTGPDHLLFIISLLLPAVLFRRQLIGSPPQLLPLPPPDAPIDTGWSPVPKLSRAMIELVKIVSGFTVSHSVTLTLSVLG
jgi:hypothetical protein